MEENERERGRERERERVLGSLFFVCVRERKRVKRNQARGKTQHHEEKKFSFKEARALLSSLHRHQPVRVVTVTIGLI